MRDILEMRGCQRYNIGVRFGSSYTERVVSPRHTQKDSLYRRY